MASRRKKANSMVAAHLALEMNESSVSGWATEQSAGGKR